MSDLLNHPRVRLEQELIRRELEALDEAMERNPLLKLLEACVACRRQARRIGQLCSDCYASGWDRIRAEAFPT